MGRYARISPKRLSSLTWSGEATYRVISYYFSLRWNWEAGGSYARRVLEPFAVPPDPDQNRAFPTPGLPAAYSLVDLGPGFPRRYRLLFADHEIMSSPDPGDVLYTLLTHIQSETFLQTGDFLLIHAGVVATSQGEGVLLPGAAGAGKTTLVAGLVRAGFGYLSDEAAAIDPVSRRVFPYPKALAMKRDRNGRFDLFEDLVATWGDASSSNGKWQPIASQWYVPAEDIRPGAYAGPCEVRFIIAPRYVPGAPTSADPITPAAALVELANQTFNFGRYRRRALPVLSGLVQGSRSYRLVSGDLKEAVRTVTELSESASIRG
jgi:hypothetical protein